jgi:hypothetical protein
MSTASDSCVYTLTATAAALLLFALFGCDQYPANEYDEVPMDEWCDQSSAMPWTGCWEEVAQIDCTTGELLYPEDKIGELRLKSDGVYSLTRHPFEHFVDYSATYKLDGEQIVFETIDTQGFDGDGTYSITEEGELLLHDIQFDVYAATEQQKSDTPAISCGYLFRR